MPSAPPISESDLHASIVQWCGYKLPADAVLHHALNEGRRGWQAQRWLKQSGAQAGWPDLELYWRGRVLLLELKSRDGRLSPAQRATHARLAAAGHFVYVARSFDEAIGCIERFISAARERAA